MRIIEVNTDNLAKAFLLVNVELNKHDPNYIRPLDKDVEEVFNPALNKAFRFGKVQRWLLQHDDGTFIGRIAAFNNKKYKNMGDEQPTGGFGFFDCINNQEAANLLLDTARDWLKEQGLEAMDGPINFGERDKWWGLVVEGFDPPLYGMNYNQPYYKDLLFEYGCKVFYYQNCYSRSTTGKLSEKFDKAHERIKAEGGFTARRAEKNNLEKYARDFCTIYNKAWAQHEGGKEMAVEAAIKMFNKMKPVMDPDLVWFAYKNDEPIALYISLPDLNQVFKYLDGKFDTWAKLKFLYYRWRGVITKFSGVVFGIVPEFQGSGIDYFLICEAAEVIQPKGRYKSTELQWQGDFNPKMNNISKNMDFKLSRRLATFRYLFDREKEYKRHPILR